MSLECFGGKGKGRSVGSSCLKHRWAEHLHFLINFAFPAAYSAISRFVSPSISQDCAKFTEFCPSMIWGTGASNRRLQNLNFENLRVRFRAFLKVQLHQNTPETNSKRYFSTPNTQKTVKIHILEWKTNKICFKKRFCKRLSPKTSRKTSCWQNDRLDDDPRQRIVEKAPKCFLSRKCVCVCVSHINLI